MRYKTLISGLIVAAIALAVVAAFPSHKLAVDAVDSVPWEVEIARKYAEGGFALIKEDNSETKIYKIGRGSMMTSAILEYASKKTGWVDSRYMFVRCAGLKERRFLSPSNPVDFAILRNARFVKPGTAKYAQVEELYNPACKEMLPAKQHEILEGIKKLWSQL